MRIIAAALLLCAPAAPVAAEAAKDDSVNASASPGASAAKTKSEGFDMARALAMFDKIFPAQPDPPPANLGLARATAGGLLPAGTYALLFDEIMSSTVERILSLDSADFGGKGEKSNKLASTTLRQEIATKDPHFEERLRITRRVVRDEMLKLSAVMEPHLREGLARSIARRFEEEQLREINAFLATESGRAFGRQSMRLWVDPDVMRSMVQAVPHMIAAMPGAVARLEAATAHLPKPNKTEKREHKARPRT